MLFDGPSNITVKGVGGRPVIDMGADHSVSVWGKGTCTITPSSSNITLDNLEFKGATGRDVDPWNDTEYSGAGIRWDGGGMLRVVNCVIHDCDQGILGTTAQGGEFLLENSVIYENGAPHPSGLRHNIRVGTNVGGVDKATYRYNWIYNATQAYDIKTGTRTNYILYNRLGDEVIDMSTEPPTTGGGEAIIDIPKGGLTYVMGNLIIKGFTAQYGCSLRYGGEGLDPGYSSQSFIVYNTFMGERSTGYNEFLRIAAGPSPAVVADNAFIHYNSGDQLYSGPVNGSVLGSNIAVYEHWGQAAADVGMVNYQPSPQSPWLDAHLVGTSLAIGAAMVPGSGRHAAHRAGRLCADAEQAAGSDLSHGYAPQRESLGVHQLRRLRVQQRSTRAAGADRLCGAERYARHAECRFCPSCRGHGGRHSDGGSG